MLAGLWPERQQPAFPVSPRVELVHRSARQARTTPPHMDATPPQSPKKGAQPFMPVTRYDAAESGDGFVRHPMV
jgi:hypothetical protein